jgi:hypothetical protein
MAEHSSSGDKLFMLAQSYMPAQEIHVLKNPGEQALSPWYRLGGLDEEVRTPAWTFERDELKRFPERE